MKRNQFLKVILLYSNPWREHQHVKKLILTTCKVEVTYLLIKWKQFELHWTWDCQWHPESINVSFMSLFHWFTWYCKEHLHWGKFLHTYLEQVYCGNFQFSHFWRKYQASRLWRHQSMSNIWSYLSKKKDISFIYPQQRVSK